MSHSCSSLSSFFGHHINSDRGFMLLSTVYIIVNRRQTIWPEIEVKEM